MKAYILSTSRQVLPILEYVKENDVKIEVLTHSQFMQLEDMPSILFFVKYDASKKRDSSLAKRNKTLLGYNVSISGDEAINIDQRITSLEEINEIVQRVKSIYLKEKIRLKHIPQGEVLLISSAKGGIGKSFFTFNLAYFLSIFKREKKILILDYNLSSGHLSRYFYHNKSGLDILIAQYINHGRIDKEDLKDVILKSPKMNFSEEYMKGIDVLLAPDNVIESAININNYPRFTEELIEMLKSIYDLIIVDTSSEKTLSYNPILSDKADKIFLLISPNTGVIIETKEMLDYLDLDKCKIIYNQYNMEREVFPLDVLSQEFLGRISSSQELKEAFSRLEFSTNIQISDNYFMPIFCSSNHYIEFEDREKYRMFFYSILNKAFPGFVLKPKFKESLVKSYVDIVINRVDSLLTKFRLFLLRR